MQELQNAVTQKNSRDHPIELSDNKKSQARGVKWPLPQPTPPHPQVPYQVNVSNISSFLRIESDFFTHTHTHTVSSSKTRVWVPAPSCELTPRLCKSTPGRRPGQHEASRWCFHSSARDCTIVSIKMSKKNSTFHCYQSFRKLFSS